MKAIKCDLKYADEIKIMPLADIHLGDPHCDYKRIVERLEEIEKTDNMYCILGGDLMDAAIKTSIGDIYGASLQPMEQLKQCVKLFKPLVDKGKVLAVVGGNHEHRIYKQDGIDVTALMCDQLGIPERYSNTTALLFIRFGKEKKSGHNRRQVYTLYFCHGSGGGKREGGKINRLADLAAIVDADIYCHHHTHLPVVFKEAYHRVSAANSSVQLVDKLFANSGACIGYGGYGDVQGFKPASLDTPIIHLCGTSRRMWAEL